MKTFRIFLLSSLSFFVFFASVVRAQYPRISSYIQQPFTSTFVSIKNAPGSTLIRQQLSNNNSGTNTTTLPFDFVYDGTLYTAGTTLILNQPGAVNFGTRFPSMSSRIVPYFFAGPASSFPSAICPLTGIQHGSTGVSLLVTGSAPNRVYTIEWSDVNGEFMPTNVTTSYQIKMYESTYTIEFLYADYNFSFGVRAEDAQTDYYLNVGLNGGSSPSFTQLITIGGTSNFSTPSTNYRYTVPSPELYLRPKPIVFGTVATGSNSQVQMSISNVGQMDASLPLTVSSVTITGDSDFTIVGGIPVPPLSLNSVSNITIQFTPRVAGLRTAILNVVSNGADSGFQQVSLSGVGFAPNIVIDTTVLFRRTRTPLAQSRTEWLHISSTGLASLFLTGFTITGMDSDQYSISHLPNAVIPPNGSDSIAITYSPTIEGRHPADLTIFSNAPNAPQFPVSLLGTGIIPKIIVSPSTIVFDSVAEGDTSIRQFTVVNPGSDTLKLLSNIFTSNDGDFYNTPIVGRNTSIAPGDSEMLSIFFSPLQRGFRQARLSFATNIPKTFTVPQLDTGHVSLDIFGTGVPKGILLIGAQQEDSIIVDETDCNIDTIKNVGDADIIVDSVWVAGNDQNDFAVQNLILPFVLPARTYKLVSVCATPHQNGIGKTMLNAHGKTLDQAIGYSEEITIYGLNVCGSAKPETLFAGNEGQTIISTTDTMCETVTNCGEIPTSYHAVISGADSLSYSILSLNPSPVIPPSGSFTYCVAFTPSAVGIVNDTLAVSSLGMPSLVVPLLGEGTCSKLTYTGSANVNYNGNQRITFTYNILNAGSAPWTPGQEIISGQDSNNFKLLTISPNRIPGGSQGVVTMEFDPMDSLHSPNYLANISWPAGGPCEDSIVSINLNASPNATVSIEKLYDQPVAYISDNSLFIGGLKNSAMLSIRLFDVLGRSLMSEYKVRSYNGLVRIPLDLTELPTGVYYVRMESDLSNVTALRFEKQ